MKKQFPLLLAVFPILTVFASDQTGPKAVFFSTSPADTLQITARPEWQLSYERASDRDLRLHILPKNGTFEMHLRLSGDPQETATPGKMESALCKKVSADWEKNSLEWEKGLRKKVYAREFAPAGRYGFATRLTDKRLRGKTPPPGEWKYLTAGICRAGKDTVLEFDLMTNTVDDAQYVELLAYIASLLIPEPGEPGWKVADGAAAAKIAHAEFSKIYGDLFRQRPYTVRRKNGKWIVEGNMWELMLGGNAYMEIDGATGKILKRTHYR